MLKSIGLNDLVLDAPLYRRSGFDTGLSRRPGLIYCNKNEGPKGLEEYTKIFGRTPEYLSLMDSDDNTPIFAIPILSKQALATRPDLLVWVYGKKERAKGISLAGLGVRDFVFSEDPLYSNFRYDPLILREKYTQLNDVYNMLADEESRLTFASVLKQRLCGEHGYLRIASYPEYQHPFCQVNYGEHVVDGGAFDGLTSRYFASRSKTGNVYAFEPDIKNLKRIENTLKLVRSHSNIAEQIVVLPFALSDKDETLKFTGGNNGSSAISTEGDDIRAVSLDNFILQNGIERIDLISLDVEGAEPRALIGMKSTIKKFRPKLQVSIYHHPSHLYTLPLLIKELCVDYVYYLGHHNTYSTETDLYCVPREKIN